MFKRILSAVVAAALVVSLLPQIDLLAKADETEEERIPWRGYEIEKGIDLDDLNFDVWDYETDIATTDWYNEAAGTENDPYIISSASDLAGIQALINGSTQTYFDYYYAEEGDYGDADPTKSVELWDYSKSVTDPTAHYYTDGALYNPTFTLEYRYTLSDPVTYLRRSEASNSYGEPIYTDYETQAQWFTSFYIDIYLGDTLIKTIDWMQYAIDYLGGLDILIDPTREDSNFSYFTRFNEGEAYVEPNHSGGLAYRSSESNMRDLFRSYGTVHAASITPDTDTITLSCFGLVPYDIGFRSSTADTITISGELDIPEGTTAVNYLGETIDLSGQNYKNYKMRNASSTELKNKLTTEVYMTYTSPMATPTSSKETNGLEQHSEASISIDAIVAGDTYTGFPNSIEHADDLYEAQLYFRQTIDTVLDENRYVVNTVKIYGPDDDVYAEYIYKSTAAIPSYVTNWYSITQARAYYSTSSNTVMFVVPNSFQYKYSNKTYNVEFELIGDEVKDILLDCIGEVAKVTKFIPIVDEALHTDYEPTMSVIGRMSDSDKVLTRQRWEAYCNGTIADDSTQRCLFENSYFRLDANIDLGSESGLSIFAWTGSTPVTFKGGFDLNGHYIIGNRAKLFAATFAPEAYLKNGTIASTAPAVSGGTLRDLDIYSLQAFYGYDSGVAVPVGMGTYVVDYAENVNLTTYADYYQYIIANQIKDTNIKLLNAPRYYGNIALSFKGEWINSSVSCDVPLEGMSYLQLGDSTNGSNWTLQNCRIDISGSAQNLLLNNLVAYNSQITINVKTNTLTSMKRWDLYNCSVVYRLPKSRSGSYASNTSGFNFYDSVVQILDNETFCDFYLLHDAYNSVINVDLSLPVIPPLFYGSLLENSAININQLNTSQENVTINSSRMYAVFSGCAIDSCQLYIESDGVNGKSLSLFSSCYVCDSDIEVDTGVAYDLNGYYFSGYNYRGSLYDNTNIRCSFRTPNTYSISNYDGSVFKNSNVFVIWADDAVGEVANSLCVTSLYKSTVVIKGPKNLIYNNRILPVHNVVPNYSTRANVPSKAYMSNRLDGTVIVDGVTLKGSNAEVVGDATTYSNGAIHSISGLHIFADINTKDVDNLAVLGCSLGSPYQVTGVGSILNAYDYYDGTPYSGSVNMLHQYQGYTTIVNDAYFKANVASANAALLTGFSYALAPAAQRLLYNIYMNLPNAPQITERSEIADGFRSGMFGYYQSPTDVGINKMMSSYVAIATQKSPLTYSNVFVPEGQSFIYEYYNPDTTAIDTWNAFETLPGGSFGLGAPTFTNRDEFNFDYVPDGAYYVEDWETAEFDGSLAYALDHGTNHYRRTTNWTVVDDIDIYDPLTGEHILTIDKHLGHTNEYFPDSITNSNTPNLNAIYKISVNKAEAGGIEITGVNGESTVDGAVYARYGSNPITGVITEDDDKTLIYAMQAINESIPIRLQPSRLINAASYSVRDDSYSGFTMPSADIEITPVFKTARYITVELSGEANHGVLIPSTEVSAEGEEIMIDVSSDTDYLITNIQVNGNPVENFRFFMPDEDVKITAEVIPFDGGITRFSLGGFAGIIDQNRHTITFNIPRIAGIRHMKPGIEYVGTSISPSNDEYLDFTEQQTYVVTYGPDDSKVAYTVDVNMGSYDMRIHDFVIDGVHGSINQARRTIDITLPNGTDLTDIVPESIAFSAESISPAVDTAVDFNVPRTYTLTADGLDSVTYLVTVRTTADGEASLVELRIGGYDATIDEATKTATINVPKLTDLSDILPNIVRYVGKTITPSKLDTLNLEGQDETYVIQSQDGMEVLYTVHANLIDDSEAHIDKFILAGYEGDIDQDKHTITVCVPYGTVLVDIMPDVLDYTAAGIYPLKDTPNNFDDEVVYTAYAVDGTEVPYTVVVKPDSGARITKFTLLGVDGIIDQDELTITVNLPAGVNVENSIPDEIVWSEGASLNPSNLAERNFTNPVEYTVTSYTGAEKNTYTVICNFIEPYDNVITQYTLNGVNGEITNVGESSGTILIEMYLDSASKLKKDDFSSIPPDVIKYSEGATLSPSADRKQDFVNDDPIYVVTSKTGAERIYTVHVIFVIPDTVARITEFSIPDPKDPDNPPYPGTIDEEEKLITVILPPDTDPEDLKEVIPNITWEGKELVPGEDTPQDFTDPIDYTVKAEDPNIRNTYTVQVIIEGQEKIYYKVITESTIGGIVTVNRSRAEEGKPVSVYCEVKQGYTFEELTIDGVAVDLTGGSYTFTMPAHDVYVKGIFKKIETPSTPEEPDAPEELDKTAEITYFEILDTPGIIDQDKKTITIELPPDTDPDDLENIIPKIIWKGKELTPGEDTPQDFNNPPDYTVRAEDPEIVVTYDVIIVIKTPEPVPPTETPDEPDVPKELDKTATITYFEILDTPGVIDQDKKIIIVELPSDTDPDDLEDIIPKIIWKGKEIVPGDSIPQDFNNPPDYTVKAEDPNIENTYKVIIKIRDPEPTPPTVTPNTKPNKPLSRDAIILEYTILGERGVIDQDRGTITVTLPESRRPMNMVSPDEVVYRGHLSPVWNTPIDLAVNNIYTVTAEDPSYSKSYILIIDWIDDSPIVPPDDTTDEVSEEPIDETVETEEIPETEEMPETEDTFESEEPETEETEESPVIIPGPTPPKPDDEDDDTVNPPTAIDDKLLWLSLLAVLSFGALLSSKKRRSQ